jgi:hypothetical protein
MSSRSRRTLGLDDLVTTELNSVDESIPLLLVVEDLGGLLSA